jgi:hypothetical protein
MESSHQSDDQQEQLEQQQEELQLQDQPPAALSEALAAANELLLSSLSASHVPCTDDDQLLQQIAAYRASIEGISRYLDAAGQGGTPGIYADPQQRQPRADAAAAAEPNNDAGALAGLGEEGVDYTVRLMLDLWSLI